MGDILCEVDGRAVLRFSPSEVSPLVLGPKDTRVEMSFLREKEKIVVHLVRQQPPSSAGAALSPFARPAYSLRQG